MSKHIETLKEWLDECQKGHDAIVRGMDNDKEWIRKAAKMVLPRSQAQIDALHAAIEMLTRDATLASFPGRVLSWLKACFGDTIIYSTEERNHRFLEESLELVQACGCTQSEAHQLVDYVFGRPVGEKHQEVGGVMITLTALCLMQSLNMHEAAEMELARVWTKIEQIRAKQASKPKHSPLPGQYPMERKEA